MASAGGRVKLEPPPSVLKIAERLERAGFETWCVGGAVRDALLGRPHLDWDLATAARPDQVRKLFKRTVPVGVEFGTVGVLDRQGIMHEVTTFRRDVLTDGRHAVVEFGASLHEDLARRDFTINAMAYRPSSGEFYDPFGGREDLTAGVIRAVGVPVARMREDRLRALRALRFAARFEFEIEPETWAAIVASVPYLGRLSRERVREELEKTMEQVRRPSQALELWRRSGVLAALVPELTGQPDFAFQAADYVGLPESTRNPERALSRQRNRLATLFLGLEPRVVGKAARGLRFSNRAGEWLTHAASVWLKLERSLFAAVAGEWTEGQLRYWVSEIGRTYFRDSFRVMYARWLAEAACGVREAVTLAGAGRVFRRGIVAAYREPVSLRDLALGGDDLIEAGVTPGPEVGRILRLLLQKVLDDPALNTREHLLELVGQWLGGAGGMAKR
jgi:tRNA nucleotidyltransferase (CCA-adding enzyme)